MEKLREARFGIRHHNATHATTSGACSVEAMAPTCASGLSGIMYENAPTAIPREAVFTLCSYITWCKSARASGSRSVFCWKLIFQCWRKASTRTTNVPSIALARHRERERLDRPRHTRHPFALRGTAQKLHSLALGDCMSVSEVETLWLHSICPVTRPPAGPTTNQVTAEWAANMVSDEGGGALAPSTKKAASLFATNKELPHTM